MAGFGESVLAFWKIFAIVEGHWKFFRLENLKILKNEAVRSYFQTFQWNLQLQSLKKFLIIRNDTRAVVPWYYIYY